MVSTFSDMIFPLSTEMDKIDKVSTAVTVSFFCRYPRRFVGNILVNHKLNGLLVDIKPAHCAIAARQADHAVWRR